MQRSFLASCVWGCTVLVTSVASGRDYAPRVLSPHNADTYSMKTFSRYQRWRDLKGQEKVYAVYRYLTDTRTGIFPMGAPAHEGEEVHPVYTVIRDPVKMINVYSVGFCGVLGPVMAGVMEDMGIGRARSVGIARPSHTFAEVNVDGKWIYLDLDVRGIFRRPDGTLASWAECKKDHTLWARPAGKPFFPKSNTKSLEANYATTPFHYHYGYNMGGHTMDYILRKGETFTRWWKPQGKRWNHHPSYGRGGMKRVLERRPVGPKGKHTSFSIHTRGNGRFVYAPSFARGSGDFEDGAYDAANVALGDNGVTLAREGQGYAVFEVRSPYVIVPDVGDYTRPDDDKDASVVEIDGRGYRLSVSTDNGLNWADVAARDGRADLTKRIGITYGYLLKIGLKGRPGEAFVKSLRITTWVQLHPASLPSLRKGTNRMRYVTGDHYGMPTRVMEIRNVSKDPEDFFKHLHVRPKKYDHTRIHGRALSRFVAKVVAPPRSRIAWFSAGGAFTSHQDGRGSKTANSMAYALDKPEGFKTFYKSDVPDLQQHWLYNVDKEVKLDEPARIVYIEYNPSPSVNNLRIYAHCLDDRKLPAGPVVIRHEWTEGGKARTKTINLPGPGAYDVDVAAEPEDVSVEISVPSSVKASAR